MQSKDRNAINSIANWSQGSQPPALNMRDASRQETPLSKIWPNEPHPVPIGQGRPEAHLMRSPTLPSRRRISGSAIDVKRRNSAAANPFSVSRLQTTLKNRFTHSGNPVAAQTIIPNLRPPKRQRTDSDVNCDSTRKLAHTSTGQHALVIDVDTEDVGILIPRPPSSPDPLLIHSFARPPDDAGSGNLPHDSDEPYHPADGPNTRKLQQKIDRGRMRRSDSAESIEDAAGFDEPLLLNGNNVKQKIKLFENPPESATENVPFIDFRTKTKLTRNMRGKQSSKTSTRFPVNSKRKDPIATSSTNFTGKPTPAPLPIGAWYLGCKLLQSDGDQPQYTLQIEGEKMVITNGASSSCRHTLQPALDRDFDSFTYSESISDCTVWQFQTTKSLGVPKKHNKHSDKSFSIHFKPGVRNAEGLITIKFDSSEGGAFESNYRSMTELLCRSIEETSYVKEPGAKAIWEVATRASGEQPDSDQPKTRARKSTEATVKKPTVYGRSSSPELAVESKPKETRSRTAVKKTIPETPKESPGVDLLATRTRPKPKPIQKPPENAVAGPSNIPRRSTRLQTTAPSTYRVPSTEPDELILVYPLDGPGAVNITNGDLKRLRPDEFLNDTLIEFGLKLLLNELREKDPEFAESVHVFSSFFYKKLNKKNLEEGYQSIRKWTLKVDLFKKKYIIVPINENLHWYLAIIYGPEYLIRPSSGTSAENEEIPQPFQEYPGLVENPPSPSLQQIPQPTSPTDTTEVEAILHFGNSCSISQPEDDANTISGSSGIDRNDLGVEAEPIVVDDVHDRLPASSPISALFSDDMMEVDQPALFCKESRSGSEPILLINRGRSRSLEVDVKPPYPEAFRAAEPHLGPLDLGDDDDDTPIDEPPLPHGEIHPLAFYGRRSTRHSIGKTYQRLSEPKYDPVSSVDEPVEIVSIQNERERTYIFTLDSLGSQHRHVIKTLHHYLIMEAKDKRNITLEPREINGRRASVPVQPNHCDCGIYLLHFARTFLSDPVRYCETILSSKPTAARQADWRQEEIIGMRDRLSAQILQLSQRWKMQRTAKEEQRKKEVAEGKDVDEVESSEGEIDIVEDVQESIGAPLLPPKSKAFRVR